MPLLYDELADWYHLLTDPADYADEAAAYRDLLRPAAPRGRPTLLDLGAGGGGNAWHLKRDFDCTLTDLSPAMLAQSRRVNPECEHAAGDMRTLRLGRAFDAVLVHDAVMYLTDEADLARAMETAFVHLRPGGAAVFAPDFLRETFAPSTTTGGGDRDGRGLRYLAWCWDPDPADDTFVTDYAYLLRDGDAVRAVHDRHLEGLFPRATWLRLLAAAGFTVRPATRPNDDGALDEIFLALRPA